MIAISLGQFWDEAPREALIAFVLGVSLGYIMRFADRLAKGRHDELLEQHEQHEDQLKTIIKHVEPK